MRTEGWVIRRAQKAKVVERQSIRARGLRATATEHSEGVEAEAAADRRAISATGAPGNCMVEDASAPFDEMTLRPRLAIALISIAVILVIPLLIAVQSLD